MEIEAGPAEELTRHQILPEQKHKSHSRSKSFQQLLDETPLTATQWTLWVLSAMGVFLDGFDFFIIGVALPLIQKDFSLTPSLRGIVAMAAIVGAFVGAMIAGPVTDRIGRKVMYTVDLLFFVFFSVASALAWNASSLIVFRFLLGLGIGADYPLGVCYIVENVPTRLRARMVVSAFSYQALGAIFGVIVGMVILTAYPSVHAWRWILAVGVVPAIIVVILRNQLPDSPRWHLARNDFRSASLAATRLLQKPVRLRAESEAACGAPLSFRSLFSRPYIRRTIFASVPWLLQDASTYGIGIFTPTVLAAIALGHQTGSIARDLGAAEGAAVIDILLLVGFMLCVLAIQYVSRVALQISGFIGMAIGLGLVVLACELDGGSHRHLGFVFGGFMLFNLMMNLGPNSTTYLLAGEVFPTRIRATGAGFAASAAKFGATLGTLLFPILAAQIGIAPLLMFLAGASVLGAIVTYAFRIETTGVALEDVEMSRSTA